MRARGPGVEANYEGLRMSISFRIARWQTPTPDEEAQELAREIARLEAPLVELWRKRVRDNVKRRGIESKLAAAVLFCELPRTLRRQAI